MSYNIELYPPQFTTTIMPVFVKNRGCPIYFSISGANERNKIAQVHITVSYQSNNLSALKKETYKSTNMIKMTGLINTNPDRTGEDKYYVMIYNDDIENGFQSNTFYKVQIRFSNEKITKGSDLYNQSNQNSFSEWSTVCLIRCMESEPTLHFLQYPNDQNSTRLSSLDVELNGYVLFGNSDQQSLNSFNIKLYDDTDTLIEDSKDVKVDKYYNSDIIKYRFKSQLQENRQYTFTVQIITSLAYSYPEPKEYTFEVVEPTYSETFTGYMDLNGDSLSGKISLHLTSNVSDSKLINLLIKRTSSESNFKVWDEVHRISYSSEGTLDYTWEDFSIKSGVYYKYACYGLNSRKQKIGLITMPALKPQVRVDFDNILLMSHDKQLCIKFNPQISSFTYNIAQGKTDTIGSKYPYIRRNGSMYYRQFPLSGTITHFMDIKDNLMQASRQELYQDSTNLYEDYNTKNNITPYEDLVYERDFRDKIIEFLYNDDVKLFRSPTLGNILIKLSDVSFTPNATLSRMIYDFSCTCYEIDLASYSNLLYYDIITDVNLFNDQELTQSTLHYGQLIRPDVGIWDVDNRYYFKAGSELIKDYIYDKYTGLGAEKKNTFHKVDIEDLTYLRIQMLDKPYLINLDTFELVTTLTSAENTVLGYVIIINGQYIFISPEGRYELSDSNLNSESKSAFKIHSVTFPRNTQAMIDFIATVTIKEDVSKLPSSISTTDTIGQLFGTFNINESIYRMIYNRYYYTKNSSNAGLINQIVELHELNHIKGIRIIGRPGLAFEIKDTSRDQEAQVTYLNDTGLLEFYDTETAIVLFKFLGYHVDEKLLKEDETQEDILSKKIPIRVTEYVILKDGDLIKLIKDLTDTKYHVNNIVIKYRNKNYIYFDLNWYLIEDNIVKVPKVEAMIDYFAEIIIKGYSLI